MLISCIKQKPVFNSTVKEWNRLGLSTEIIEYSIFEIQSVLSLFKRKFEVFQVRTETLHHLTVESGDTGINGTYQLSRKMSHLNGMIQMYKQDLGSTVG